MACIASWSIIVIFDTHIKDALKDVTCDCGVFVSGGGAMMDVI